MSERASFVTTLPKKQVVEAPGSFQHHDRDQRLGMGAVVITSRKSKFGLHLRATAVAASIRARTLVFGDGEPCW